MERFWPDFNSRVNYPVKRALISIIEENDYSMSDPVLKYCVSWITNYICQVATQHLIKGTLMQIWKSPYMFLFI